MRKFIFALLALILACGNIYPYPAEDVRPLCGRDYFPEVKKLISQAKKNIYISMYIATYYPDYPKSLPNQLLNELAKAQERGVKVNVILDQGRVSSLKGQYNDLAYFFLKNSSTQVDYDIPSVKLHDKLIIIDEYITVIGSHNWSNSALKENRESSVVIKSPEVARDFIDWIKSTPLSSRRVPPPQSKTPNIYLPYQFLTDPKLCIKLSDMRMELYLYLLQKWEQNNRQPFMLDYPDAASFIGIADHDREYYRKNINRLLRVLNKRFKLVSFKLEHNEPAEIKLLDYNNMKKPYIPDTKECFVIPGAFYEFGWAERLSASAKYFYFISLIETSLTMDPKGWWSHSQDHLYKKYHADPRIQSDGIMELNRYNLLQVEYGMLVYPFEKYLSAPKYLLLPLYSWQWHEEQLNELEKLYGQEKITQARKWAEVVQDENNLEVIEKLINLREEYGEKIVQYAVDKVAGKRIGNPKRSFPYIEGIILTDYREQQEEPED